MNYGKLRMEVNGEGQSIVQPSHKASKTEVKSSHSGLSHS